MQVSRMRIARWASSVLLLTACGAEQTDGASTGLDVPAENATTAGDAGAASSCRHPLMGARPYLAVAHPPENPDRDDKALLGKILFWDEQLSSDNTVACGSCHRGSAGGSDPRSAGEAARLTGPDGMLDAHPSPLSDDGRGTLGIVACDPEGKRTGSKRQVTGRKAPSAFDAMFSGELFWDGRAGKDFHDPESGEVLIRGVLDPQSGRVVGGALESQAVGPFLNDVEMACAKSTWPKLYEKLALATPLSLSTRVPAELQRFIEEHGGSYPKLFERVFGDTLKSASDPNDVINAKRIAFAIATYERRLTSNQTPWDRWNAGEAKALTKQQVRGYELFMDKGNCQSCHAPPLFMDLIFHYNGFHQIKRDPGKGGLAGGDAAELGMMKTPTLRNVGLREPGGLLHQGDGPGHDLASVMKIYNDGGRRDEPEVAALIDPLIVPLELTDDEQAAIIDFMRNGLTDPRVKSERPPFDRPTLRNER